MGGVKKGTFHLYMYTHQPMYIYIYTYDPGLRSAVHCPLQPWKMWWPSKLPVWNSVLTPDALQATVQSYLFLYVHLYICVLISSYPDSICIIRSSYYLMWSCFFCPISSSYCSWSCFFLSYLSKWFLSTHLSIHPSFRPSIHLSINQSIYLSSHRSMQGPLLRWGAYSIASYPVHSSTFPYLVVLTLAILVCIALSYYASLSPSLCLSYGIYYMYIYIYTYIECWFFSWRTYLIWPRLNLPRLIICDLVTFPFSHLVYLSMARGGPETGIYHQLHPQGGGATHG